MRISGAPLHPEEYIPQEDEKLCFELKNKTLSYFGARQAKHVVSDKEYAALIFRKTSEIRSIENKASITLASNTGLT